LRAASVFGAAALAFVAPCGSGFGAPAPMAPILSFAELATPLPAPYDPNADAHAQVAAAQVEARAGGKLLLIEMGGNWCADCRILDGFMKLPAIAAFVRAHYVVVEIDAGHMNRNLDIAARWGVGRLDGVPNILIVDGHNRLINAGHTAALTDVRSLEPQALADWLARWTP